MCFINKNETKIAMQKNQSKLYYDVVLFKWQMPVFSWYLYIYLVLFNKTVVKWSLKFIKLSNERTERPKISYDMILNFHGLVYIEPLFC